MYNTRQPPPHTLSNLSLDAEIISLRLDVKRLKLALANLKREGRSPITSLVIETELNYTEDRLNESERELKRRELLGGEE